MGSSRQGVLWTSSNSEHETAGIFQALSAEAVTLANLPLYTEHLAVTQRQIPEVLRRSKGTWKQGAPEPRLYCLLAPAFQSEAAGHWKSRVTKLRIYSCSTLAFWDPAGGSLQWGLGGRVGQTAESLRPIATVVGECGEGQKN